VAFAEDEGEEIAITGIKASMDLKKNAAEEKDRKD
jgi:hypothetical protein